MQSLKIIGLMSGTSLDGLDIAACRFSFDQQQYHFELLKTKAQAYDELWINRLRSAHLLSGEALSLLDVELGQLHGNWVREFTTECSFGIDAIASHGHTVLHQPHLGLTLQVGNAAQIAAITQKTTISNFRTLDVALGGQGAPLVPIGDRLLFGKYDACLNLGGIANISLEKDGHRIAWDIVPFNMLFNAAANAVGLAYDEDGGMAARGQVKDHVLARWNALDYFKKPMPKSLGREFFEMHYADDLTRMRPEDFAATAMKHAVDQIKRGVEEFAIKQILVTGGGAFNRYFVENMNRALPVHWVIPDAELINFKEALVFAFLGYLRLHDQVNTLSSVTGARMDSCGGFVTTPL
ncbi:MAG: anhydro-N-acetylmuramic acid kinase [Flavobacteriales bacterium]